MRDGVGNDRKYPSISLLLLSFFFHDEDGFYNLIGSYACLMWSSFVMFRTCYMLVPLMNKFMVTMGTAK